MHTSLKANIAAIPVNGDRGEAKNHVEEDEQTAADGDSLPNAVVRTEASVPRTRTGWPSTGGQTSMPA
jgi:hypothetical protein